MADLVEDTLRGGGAGAHRGVDAAAEDVGGERTARPGRVDGLAGLGAAAEGEIDPGGDLRADQRVAAVGAGRRVLRGQLLLRALPAPNARFTPTVTEVVDSGQPRLASI